MSNERFEKYYKAQKIVPEAEWEPLMKALREPLPSTFRITGNRLFVPSSSSSLTWYLNHETERLAQALKRSITESYIPQLESTTFEGEPLPVPASIPWYVLNSSSFLSTNNVKLILLPRYPDGLAWQLGVPRKSLRKSAEYKRFHNFLVYETDVVCSISDCSIHSLGVQI